MVEPPLGGGFTPGAPRMELTPFDGPPPSYTRAILPLGLPTRRHEDLVVGGEDVLSSGVCAANLKTDGGGKKKSKKEVSPPPPVTEPRHPPLPTFPAPAGLLEAAGIWGPFHQPAGAGRPHAGSDVAPWDYGGAEANNSPGFLSVMSIGTGALLLPSPPPPRAHEVGVGFAQTDSGAFFDANSQKPSEPWEDNTVSPIRFAPRVGRQQPGQQLRDEKAMMARTLPGGVTSLGGVPTSSSSPWKAGGVSPKVLPEVFFIGAPEQDGVQVQGQQGGRPLREMNKSASLPSIQKAEPNKKEKHSAIAAATAGAAASAAGSEGSSFKASPSKKIKRMILRSPLQGEDQALFIGGASSQAARVGASGEEYYGVWGGGGPGLNVGSGGSRVPLQSAGTPLMGLVDKKLKREFLFLLDGRIAPKKGNQIQAFSLRKGNISPSSPRTTRRDSMGSFAEPKEAEGESISENKTASPKKGVGPVDAPIQEDGAEGSPGIPGADPSTVASLQGWSASELLESDRDTGGVDQEVA